MPYSGNFYHTPPFSSLMVVGFQLLLYDVVAQSRGKQLVSVGGGGEQTLLEEQQMLSVGQAPSQGSIPMSTWSLV